MSRKKSLETILKVAKLKTSEIEEEFKLINNVVKQRELKVEELVDIICSLNNDINELKLIKSSLISRGSFTEIESINYSFKKFKKSLIKFSVDLDNQQRDLEIGNKRLDQAIELLKNNMNENKVVENLIQSNDITESNKKKSIENDLLDNQLSIKNNKISYNK